MEECQTFIGKEIDDRNDKYTAEMLKRKLEANSKTIFGLVMRAASQGLTNMESSRTMTADSKAAS